MVVRSEFSAGEDYVSRSVLRDQVAQRILTEVFERRFLSGSRLVVQRLAERFGVSPTPVREALVELAGLGIVDLLPNRGAVVRPFGDEQLRDISQVRRALEMEACRSACGKIDATALHDLRSQLKRLRKARPNDEWDRDARAADSRLHLLIAESCGNPRLAQEIRRYLSLFRSVRNISHVRDSWNQYRRSNDVPEHLQIVEALVANDPERAAAAIDRHIRSITNVLSEVVFSDPRTHQPSAKELRPRKVHMLLAAVAATLCCTHWCMAQDQWIAADGDWNVPGNWNPANVPGAGDDVDITETDGVNRTINYDYAGSPVELAWLTLDLTNFSGSASSVLSVSANDLTADFEYIGDSGAGSNGVGTFTQSGGVNSVGYANTNSSGGGLYLGENSTDQGFYTLGGAGVLTAYPSGQAGGEVIGISGTGSFLQTGGTNTTSGLALGQNGGAIGTYTLGGTGSLVVPYSEIVGLQGTGSFNQCGGTNVVDNNGDPTAGGLFVGYYYGTGSYTLSGTGSLSVCGNEIIGYAGSGTFNQCGGTNTAGELDMGYYGPGVYSLGGGTLTASSVYVGGSSSGSGGTGILNVCKSGSLSDSGTVTVFSTGRVNIYGGSASVGGLAICTGGDVNVNASLAINFDCPADDPISTVVGYLQNGYNSGSWTGLSGIISTSAAAVGRAVTVGYLDGNVDTTDSAEVAPNQILVKYTLAGDANLDGIVNFSDFATVLKYFDQPGTDWAQGNFEYAANNPDVASTNFNDFADVLKNFLQPFPGAPAIEPTVGQLPEPANLGLWIAGAAGLLWRRGRRARTKGTIA